MNISNYRGRLCASLFVVNVVIHSNTGTTYNVITKNSIDHRSIIGHR